MFAFVTTHSLCNELLIVAIGIVRSFISKLRNCFNCVDNKEFFTHWWLILPLFPFVWSFVHFGEKLIIPFSELILQNLEDSESCLNFKKGAVVTNLLTHFSCHASEIKECVTRYFRFRQLISCTTRICSVDRCLMARNSTSKASKWAFH